MGSPSTVSVNGVAMGHSVIGPDAWSDIAEQLHLSPRELEIAQGIFDDEKNEQIAQRLGISPHTVHTYLVRLYHKLDINSRAQLIVRIMVEIHSDGR